MTALEAKRCPYCGVAAFSPVRVERSVQADDGVELVYSVELMKCASCGESGYAPGQSLQASRTRAGVLRSHAGFLTPDEIRAIRERFHLTQADLEQLLGTGRKTVVRWESGTVCQNATAERVLRLIDKVPGAFEVLAAQAGLLVVAPDPIIESVIHWLPVRLIAHTLVGPDLRLLAGGAPRVAGSPPVTFYTTSRNGLTEVVRTGVWDKDQCGAANADYALAS